MGKLLNKFNNYGLRTKSVVWSQAEYKVWFELLKKFKKCVVEFRIGGGGVGDRSRYPSLEGVQILGQERGAKWGGAR